MEYAEKDGKTRKIKTISLDETKEADMLIWEIKTKNIEYT